MSHIFASLHPFFEEGLLNGRTQANAGFMQSLLALDPFDEYHFFVANPTALRHAWQNLASPPPALTRGALHALHRMEIPTRFASTPYHVLHFSDPVSGFAHGMAARNRWSPELFPVTCVNHTLSYAHYAAPLLGHVWEGCTVRDAVGCNSSAARAVLGQWYAHARSAYKLEDTFREPCLEVIPMGAPPEVNYAPDPAARQSMRQRLEMGDEAVLLLLFGRIAMDDKMDPQPLLMALRRVRQSHPQLDMTLVISGRLLEGDQAPQFLAAIARAFGLRLAVLPNPSLQDKQALFAAADIFLSPSDNIQETFGLTLAEAALAGLPVIASDWDGYRDIVVPEVTGLLIPTLAPAVTPELDALGAVLFDNQHHFLRSQRTAVRVPELADAVARLASSADERQRMGRAAREHALAHFTYEGVVRRWLRFWEELRARPISAAEEARARKAKHPQHLPFGSVFSPYATAALCPETQLVCTHMGHALRQGNLPWQSLGMTMQGIREEDIRPLLVLTRKACSMAELTARTCPNTTEAAAERLETHILWALKHDLLEVAVHD